jgi:hypothetical protein
MEPSCQVTPWALDSNFIDICLARIRTYTCPVNASIGTVAFLVTPALLDPPTDAGEMYPEPEFLRGKSVNVPLGLPAVEPLNVISGSALRMKTNLSPSSISNSAEVIEAEIGSVVPVSLSSTPLSWFTRLLEYVAASGKFLSPESSHAVLAIVP